jgi:hypothetical protein
MRSRVSPAHALLAAVLLLLSACSGGAPREASNASVVDYGEDVSVGGNAAENVVEANATGPESNVVMINASAGAETVFCEAVDHDTSAAECRRYTRDRANLQAGLGVFEAPREMKLGESRDLVLSVGKKANAEEVHAAVGTERAKHVEITTQVGHYMTATLSGGGFDITPSGPQAKTLAADRSEVWQWRIKAKEEGAQKLMLTISVDAQAADGSRSRYDLETKTFDIAVNVTDSERRARKAQEIKKNLDAGTTVLSGLEKLFIALTAVVVALGGVWIAIRTFGKKKDAEKPKDEAPKDDGPRKD